MPHVQWVNTASADLVRILARTQCVGFATEGSSKGMARSGNCPQDHSWALASSAFVSWACSQSFFWTQSWFSGMQERMRQAGPRLETQAWRPCSNSVHPLAYIKERERCGVVYTISEVSTDPAAPAWQSSLKDYRRLSDSAPLLRCCAQQV